MRTFILTILLSLSSFYFAQNTIVRYEEFRQAEGQTNISFLIYNDISSYNIQSYLKLYANYKELLADKEFVESDKFVANIKKSNIFSNEYFGITNFIKKGSALYKDEVNIKWNTQSSKENKTILGYKCKLATADFRGRKYAVWYTLDIPVPIGPWKLGGLPGLILKADVDDGAFLFEATSIVRNTNLTIPEKYITLYEKNKDKIYDYKKVFAFENKALEDFRQEQISYLPKNVNLTDFPSVRSNLIEKNID